MVLETNGSGPLLTSYVLGGTELLSQTRGEVTSYNLHDGQGSVRTLTDESGAVTDTYAYTAFGELYAQTGSTINAYLYTGQQFDSPTGLYSLRARYYNPGVGRFLSRDIANLMLMTPGEIDRYIYAINNPINAIDPTGMQAFVEYSETNQNSEEESASVSEFGQNTTDFYAEELASQEIQPAMELRTMFFKPNSNVVIARGKYVVNGEIRTAVSMNNFYTKNIFEYNRAGVEAFRKFATSQGWEFEGGILEANATRTSTLHAEQNMLKIVQRVNLEANSRFTVGISHPTGLCPNCFSNLGEQIFSQFGRGIRAIFGNNIHVIIMGIK